MWTYADATNSTITDGTSIIPLGQATGLSAMAAALVAAGAVLPYVAPVVAPAVPAYTLAQLQSVLIKAGTIPPPTAAAITQGTLT
jgi:hypothetical protein